MYIIVLMNNSLLGGQFCTDSVNVQQDGDNQIGRGRLAIIPRLNFTCNGRITNIRARVNFDNNEDRVDYPFFQVWRPLSTNPTVYNKTGEVQLQSDQVTMGSNNFLEGNIVLTGNNTIEFQSGDVVGYYHPPQSRYQVRNIQTDGYMQYRFDGSPAPTSVILNNADRDENNRQPLIQFIIGKYIYAFNQPNVLTKNGVYLTSQLLLVALNSCLANLLLNPKFTMHHANN